MLLPYVELQMSVFLQNEFKIMFIYALSKLVCFLVFFLLLLMDDAVAWRSAISRWNEMSRHGIVLFQDESIIEIYGGKRTGNAPPEQGVLHF